MSRLFTLAFVLLSLGFLVQASPRVVPATMPVDAVSTARNDNSPNCFDDTCFGGLELAPLMEKLQDAVEVRLKSLDQSLETNGGNYVDILQSIERLICEANKVINGYQLSFKDKISGGLLKAVKIWRDMVMDTADHLGKWTSRTEFGIMGDSIEQVDTALKNCLKAITGRAGILGSFVGVSAKLFTKAQFGILHAVKFNSTAAALGPGQ